MVLEATMVCVDTSDWMRNGDYIPTRMQAQADAVNLLAGAKTQDNPESSVGVLSYGGARPKVLVALTQELGNVLTSMSQVGIDKTEDASLCKGVAMAQLALKHRQNKNQRQRVVLFIGSPNLASVSDPELISLGKKLKKNSVALDIVDMASDDDTTSKCQILLDAVNSNENSHLVSVPARNYTSTVDSDAAGSSSSDAGGIVSDVLLSSPIFMGEDGMNGSGFAAAAMAGAAAVAAANNNNANANNGDLDEFGVDPNLDPELALALRVSMEEERARQQANKDNTTTTNNNNNNENENETKNGDAEMDVDGSGKDGANVDTTTTPTTAAKGNDMSAVAAAVAEDVEMMDEDVLLQQALAMSMGQTTNTNAETTTTNDNKSKDEKDDVDIDDEDPTLAMALKMSMEQDGTAAAANDNKGTETTAAEQQLHDPAYVASVLGSLPGVDPNDPALQAALAGLGGAAAAEEEEEDGKKGDGDDMKE